jgi:NarL family two-component system response regulator LiaR
VARSIRIALVNDYMIVLEGLRSLLESSDPEIRIVELDVRKEPRRRVDVTLLDTYGEAETFDERIRSLGADAENGAIVVFSFSDRPEAVRRALRAGAQGFISKAVPRDQIINGIRAAADGERVVLTQRTQHAQIDEKVRWPGRDIGLTERESELLSLLSTGMTNRELGSHLYISEHREDATSPSVRQTWRSQPRPGGFCGRGRDTRRTSPPIQNCRIADHGSSVPTRIQITRCGYKNPYAPNERTLNVATVDKAKNKAQEAKGHVKEAAGKATNDKSLETEGKGDQVKGNLKQAGEKVKDAFRK